MTRKTPEELTEVLSKKYNVVSDFMTNNKLKVNADKTHLLVTTTKQKRRHVDTNSVSICSPSGTVFPTSTERLLRAEIHQDMKWRKHVLDKRV